MNPNRFATHSLKDMRILRIMAAAIEAVDPYRAVAEHLPEMHGRVYGLGIGKAAVPMMDALAARLPLSGGLAVTKFAPRGDPGPYSVMEGGHPVPDARSLEAGERVLEFVSALAEDDTLVCLISGGGSALVTAPEDGISLQDMQVLTSALLASGAPIDEINILRRSLDRVKGGGLARATKARVLSLILSDVVGSPLEAIASGPTVHGPTTRQDALEILRKYDLERHTPKSILEILHSTPPADDERLFAESIPGEAEGPGVTNTSRVQNIIIGDNALAARAALEQAEGEGFHARILTSAMQGEARERGREMAQLLREAGANEDRPFCWIAGGETTVTIRGEGKGGRNQELALAAVDELAGVKDVFLVTLATDGDDGPTDAAGAAVTGETAARAESLGLRAADHLAHNDAYPFFEALGDLLKTGPTGTNVNDLTFLIAT